jgi:hypothetical protein
VSTAATTIASPPAANDNAYFVGAPVVRTPRHRSDATYARSENVILPLRFAERMPGWHARPGART